MDDPLPQLTLGDPRNLLTEDARRRLARAHSEADRIRAEAEAKIDAKGIGSDKAHYERNQANLKAARAVLKTASKEYAAIGFPLNKYRECIKEEIESAAYSLELYDSQRRLLETEFCFPLTTKSETKVDPLKALLEEVAARFIEKVRLVNQERNAAYEDVKRHCQGDCMARAIKRFETVEAFAIRKACEHVEIYKLVAEQPGAKPLLSASRLQQLREDIKRSIHLECISVMEMNVRDCQAAGTGRTLALEALTKNMPGIEARIFDFANDKIRVLEASSRTQKASRLLKVSVDSPAAKGSHEKKLGPQLKALFEETNLTLEELAEKLGIDPTNVSRHFQGRSTPTPRNRRKYERVLSKLLNQQIVITKTQAKRS